MASKQSEAILEIGGEGGGYTILSKVTKDGRMFRLSADSLDFDSDDEENWTSRQETWRFSIDAVFADLNPIWYRLYPLLVHPEFASEIWQKYVSASQEAREGPPRQHSNGPNYCLDDRSMNLEKPFHTQATLPCGTRDVASKACPLTGKPLVSACKRS
jgi:hypothetical protein